MKKRIIACLLLGASMACTISAVGYAQTVDSGLPVRTKESIESKWATYNPEGYQGQIYDEIPVISTEKYSPGKVNISYLRGGLARANFYRYISGLPDNLELEEGFSRSAQYGAVISAAVYGNLTQEPKQPKNMDNDFYYIARSSARNSNVITVDASRGNKAAKAIDRYMGGSIFDLFKEEYYGADKSGYGKDRLTTGPNLQLLDPYLKKIGIGLASRDNQAYYTVLDFTDLSSRDVFNYSYIPYPAQGYFPADVFRENQAWTIMLSSASFSQIKDEVYVELTRQSDQYKWTSRSTDDSHRLYLNLQLGVNWGDRIHFQPKELDKIRDGDVFTVKVTGLKTSSDEAAELKYDVKFFYINKVSVEPDDKEKPSSRPSAPEATVPADTGNKGEPNQKPSDIQFPDIAGHWSESTVKWGIAKGIVDGYADGKFQPDRQVSEEEFLSMLLKAFGHKTDSNSGAGWSDSLYTFAMEHKYPVKGAENRAARSQMITRESMAEIVAAADGEPLLNDEAIGYLLTKSYAEGRTDNGAAGFAGQEGLTRSEALQIIRNVQEHGIKSLQ
ncbi:hypothetical protein GCM10023310_11850 [Paenibacillus vulneris]|uniref:S-layer homology domain-containing protein n=1 Tax=Paenibacillus vulneris TaxID=1133364 RepID=A0ABW3UHB3_9BACL